MTRFTRYMNIIIAIIVLVIIFITGCGIAPVSVGYTPTGTGQRIVTGAPIVKLEVTDAREKKIFFRTVLGDNDDEGKNGILRLARSPKEVFEDGFTEALQSAGYSLRENAEFVYEVRIKRFLANDPQKSPHFLESDIVLEVMVKRSEKVLARKTIFERDSEKMTFGQVWQYAIPPLLNRSLSRVIENAVQDNDIIAALGANRAIAGNASYQQDVSSPKPEYVSPATSLTDSTEKVGLSGTRHETAVKVSSVIAESGVNTHTPEPDFVIRVVKGLPHRFPEGDVKGLWLSSVPMKLDVFAFPKGYSGYGGTFGVFSDWVKNKTDTPYYLGKTPLLAKLRKGTYDILFVHPPIKDPSYRPRYKSYYDKTVRGQVRQELFPFIAPREPELFAVYGDYYWTQTIEVTSNDNLSTAIALFQREDQTVSDMLSSLPSEESFKFSSVDSLRDPNKLVSSIDKARGYGRHELSSQEVKEILSFSLTREEVADAEKMLKRTGVWAKEFSDNRSFAIEVQPNKMNWFMLRYPLTENGREGKAQVGFRVLEETDSNQSQTQGSKLVAADTPPTPQQTAESKKTTSPNSLHIAVFQNDIATVKSLLAAGADVDAKGIQNATPLYFAAQQGYIPIVKLLLEKGANVNARTDQGTMPLFISASCGHREVAELLIANGAKVDARTDKDASPLYIASQMGHTEVVKLLLEKGSDINARTNDGGTAIHVASQAGKTAVVELLLANGAYVNSKTKEGFTPLFAAAQEGHIELVKLLLAKGAEVNIRQKEGSTPLHSATKHPEVTKLLLANGADVNARGRQGSTPLYTVAEIGNVTVAELLLANGARVDAENNWGRTPLHPAAQEGHLALAKLLLSKGAKVNVHASDQGSTPLHLAAEKKQTAMVELLLAAGADVNVKDKLGQTPLHFAVGTSNLKVAEMLIANGANVNAKNKDACAPLHFAADIGNTTLCKLLLDNGANVNALEFQGATPLDFAVSSGRTGAAELLRKRGGKTNRM